MLLRSWTRWYEFQDILNQVEIKEYYTTRAYHIYIYKHVLCTRQSWVKLLQMSTSFLSPLLDYLQENQNSNTLFPGNIFSVSRFWHKWGKSFQLDSIDYPIVCLSFDNIKRTSYVDQLSTMIKYFKRTSISLDLYKWNNARRCRGRFPVCTRLLGDNSGFPLGCLHTER